MIICGTILFTIHISKRELLNKSPRGLPNRMNLKVVCSFAMKRFSNKGIFTLVFTAKVMVEKLSWSQCCCRYDVVVLLGVVLWWLLATALHNSALQTRRWQWQCSILGLGLLPPSTSTSTRHAPCLSTHISSICGTQSRSDTETLTDDDA